MNSRAFTLIELVVSIAIFALMTALVVVKYGNFNQSVLLTNLAYDVALTVRTAQTYGLSVKSTSGDDPFKYGYGVHFSTDAGSDAEMILYADFDENNRFTENTNEEVNIYTIKRGAVISDLCIGTESMCASGVSGGESIVDITFKRPDPNAQILGDDNCGGPSCFKKYARIIVQATDGSTRAVSVRENGQISVED